MWELGKWGGLWMESVGEGQRLLGVVAAALWRLRTVEELCRPLVATMEGVRGKVLGFFSKTLKHMSRV